MNFGPWELLLALLNVVIIAVPVILIIWLVRVMSRIEKSLGRIETKLDELKQR